MASQSSQTSPPHSRASSISSSRGRRSQLSLDLSDLPPLIQPSPPSNTLLITNLQEPSIFHPSNLVTIRELISTHAPVHTWAPLRSFRRIVVSFFDVEAAIAIRQQLDGETIMGDRVRVYFGTHTPLNPTDQHLPLPKSDKLFFISPPPSPPHGWELRNEDPPNKEVHADDLAAALAKLHARSSSIDQTASPTSPTASDAGDCLPNRQRSGSATIVYHPEDHGDSPDLPAIAVEDTTITPDILSPTSPIDDDKMRFVHTARPPSSSGLCTFRCTFSVSQLVAFLLSQHRFTPSPQSRTQEPPQLNLAAMATTPSGSPVAIVCVGMAGSGKTTFMQRINSHLHSKKTPPYVINLDPAVRHVPFDSNIDIRDSVNYKQVMKQYNLGPNGGIITSLNLFSTKIDQILGLLEKRTAPPPPPAEGEAPKPQSNPISHILVDTPGQIEVFVWSASGDILLGSLASTFPTVIAYVIDTPRTASTSTFMSNMLYACSILYKTKLPMILVFNKTDVKDAEFAKEWMTDFEAFQEALREEENGGGFGGLEGGEGPVGGGSGYMGSLLNSMSLMLDEFYRHLSVVGVSSMTGAGVDDFFTAVQDKAAEFERDYKPELERRKEERIKEKEVKREKELSRLMRDMNVGADAGKPKLKGKGRRKAEPETVSDVEDDEEDDEEEDIEPVYDDDEFDDENNTADEGLTERYKKALKEGQSAPSGEDMSFASYIARASMG
ncbi:uncharacterized protein K452DRAFT_359106 [Aplosporella prunicola CBS 121167]|uniref:GPN-loop GTPase 1 n=1 Tax=Aplosporella prunicola CBS 121167 TaxID=1176127 RepID=A0A6A6BEG9_9PEZI|nr:uncharacterized protein K452DRAFT_359106 [Aplosporella prunicola CBS 121167]KAF2141327.1 hypothetical protein K452DRAFT_359106 [Aplosporella prunicola CBS 121167]